ncbi:hypothetical protein [Streptomyces virginiae]|uniref:hypothetical protein n=1 Tax=Streptomyces virginiae TaxID=1961 RepID=UPI00369BC4E2
MFALNRLHMRGGPWPRQVRIRSTFLVGTPSTQPPIGRIAAPRGLNLQIYLLALFEAQSRKRAGAAGACPLPISGGINPWTDLVVSEAKQNTQAKAPITSTQNRARQIKSAIKRLSDENLVLRNVGDPKRPYPLMLLHESAESQLETLEYVIPETRKAPFVLTLPVQFFTNGWIYLLTDAEIRMYLVLKHLSATFSEAHLFSGVYCSDRDRNQRYWISRDIYEAHLTLSRFGLIEVAPNRMRHRDGKLMGFKSFVESGSMLPPHRFFVLGDSPFFESPLGKIRRALLNYPPSYSQMTRGHTPRNAPAGSLDG